MSLQVDAYLTWFRNLSPELQAVVLPQLVREVVPAVQAAVRSELEKQSWVVTTYVPYIEATATAIVEAKHASDAIDQATIRDPCTVALLLYGALGDIGRITPKLAEYVLEISAYQLVDNREAGARFISAHSNDPDYVQLMHDTTKLRSPEITVQPLAVARI